MTIASLLSIKSLGIVWLCLDLMFSVRQLFLEVHHVFKGLPQTLEKKFYTSQPLHLSKDF